MQVNAINSFCGRQSRIQKQQELEAKREIGLDNIIKEMMPQLCNGDADVVYISTSKDKNNNVKMDFVSMKDRLEEDFSVDRVGQVFVLTKEENEVKTKKSFLEKLKEVFSK